MKKFMIIGMLAVLIFGVASIFSITTAVYGPGCANAPQAQANRSILPKITNGVSMTGWPLRYLVINHNEDCQKPTEVLWNAAALGVDLMVSLGLGAMVYVTIDTINDWYRPKRVVEKE